MLACFLGKKMSIKRQDRRVCWSKQLLVITTNGMATGDKKRRLKIKKDVQNNYGKADQQWLGNEDDGTKVREVRQLKPKKASKAKKKKGKADNTASTKMC